MAGADILLSSLEERLEERRESFGGSVGFSAGGVTVSAHGATGSTDQTTNALASVSASVRGRGHDRDWAPAASALLTTF